MRTFGGDLTDEKLAVGKKNSGCRLSKGKGQEVWEEWNEQGHAVGESGGPPARLL